MKYLVKENTREGKPKTLLLTHENSSAHKIEIQDFKLVDNNGAIIKNLEIDEKLTKIFLKRLKTYDPNQARLIPIQYLELNEPNTKKLTDKEVLSNLVHSNTHQESSYTSTGSKLAWHYPIFQKLKDTGYSSIIRATLTLHQKCSSRCPYCSTIARNKSDTISLEEAKEFVSKLYFDQAIYNQRNFTKYNTKYKNISNSDIRLKGLILSGGGQPNLWPHFTEFVEWLAKLDIDIGLITNGFPKNVPEEVYKLFKWIRISITPEDASPHYINQRFENQYIPQTVKSNKSLTVGYSYVFGEWTDKKMLPRLEKSAENNEFDYVRVLTDCNSTRSEQIISHQRLSNELMRNNLIDSKGNPTGKIFHQLKYHGTKEEASSIWEKKQCLLQSYNVFWDTTGHDENGYSYCYPCDSVTVLANGDDISDPSLPERRFEASTFGTYKNIEVENLYIKPLKSFFDPTVTCSSCLFMKNNSIISNHLEGKSDLQNYYNRNSDTPPNHINFP